MLIIICGLPGSGKSTLAKELAKQFDPEPICISTDSIRKEMIKEPKYTEEEKKQVYDQMRTYAEKILVSRRNVIVDATFYQASERRRFLDLAKTFGTEAYVILCTLSEKETEKRLKKRKNSLSDADFRVYLKLKKEFQPIEEKHIEVDSVLPTKKRIQMVLDFIGGKNG